MCNASGSGSAHLCVAVILLLYKPEIMKTEKELNADILSITMKINDSHPELAKFMGEVPVRISEVGGAHVNLKNLKDYHSSLVALLAKYDITHRDDSTVIS